ncbi:hypothetical protein GCM10010440_69180 [Kitasatospora cinereorecta]
MPAAQRPQRRPGDCGGSYGGGSYGGGAERSYGAVRGILRMVGARPVLSGDGAPPVGRVGKTFPRGGRTPGPHTIHTARDVVGATRI